jgi:cellobiose phosphorylase
VEPFVVVADIYGEKALTGQGGWSWYTGSAGWMYRVALESVLGLRWNGDSILLKPAISENWPGFSIDLRLEDEETTYHIQINNPNRLQSGLLEGSIDGEVVQFEGTPAILPLKRDRQHHEILLHILSNS